MQNLFTHGHVSLSQQMTFKKKEKDPAQNVKKNVDLPQMKLVLRRSRCDNNINFASHGNHRN